MAMHQFVYNLDEHVPLPRGHPDAPPHPCRIWACGGPGGGKTMCIMNLLLGDVLEVIQGRRKCGHRYFPVDDVVVITPNAGEPKWQLVQDVYEFLASDEADALGIGKDVTFEAVPPETAPDPADVDTPRSRLVVCDDCMAERTALAAAERWFTRSRHANASVAFVSHRWASAGRDQLRTLRANATHIILFPGAFPDGLRGLRRALGELFPADRAAELAALFTDAWRKDRHAFFVIRRADGVVTRGWGGPSC